MDYVVTIRVKSCRFRATLAGQVRARGVGRSDQEFCEGTKTPHVADDVPGPSVQFPRTPLRMEVHHLSYRCVSTPIPRLTPWPHLNRNSAELWIQ